MRITKVHPKNLSDRRDTIKDVLDLVERQALKRQKSGFNEFRFTFGVINSFLIIFVFGVYPQHFWLLYLLESLYFIPTKFIQMIRAVPNQALYYLDFCWIMNFCGIIFLLIIMFDRDLSELFHRRLFLAAFGISCGPLLASNISLPFIALIFHDISSMTSVFIHIYPPLLLYTLRWKVGEVTEAWPNTFLLEYDINFYPSPRVSFIDSIFGCTTIVYLLWLALYLVWMILLGFKNVEKFDTVFHSTMRDGLCVKIGSIVWKRPVQLSIEQTKTNEFETRDFMIYCAGHVILFFTSLVILAYSCTLSSYVHGSILGICTVICIWRGARRYTYYSTKMYSILIRKHFADELNLDALTPGSGAASSKKGYDNNDVTGNAEKNITQV